MSKLTAHIKQRWYAFVRMQGARLIRWGTYLMFDHGRNSTHRSTVLERMKHAINAETELGAQIESGGHMLRIVQPVPGYVTVSILNVLRDAEAKLLCPQPMCSVPDIEYPDLAEYWSPHLAGSAKQARTLGNVHGTDVPPPEEPEGALIEPKLPTLTPI